jgi:hypothetical protein
MSPSIPPSRIQEEVIAALSRYLSRSDTPSSLLPRCLEYYAKILKSDTGRRFKDNLEVARLVAFIAVREGGHAISPNQIGGRHVSLKKLYLASKILGKTSFPVAPIDMEAVARGSASILKKVDPMFNGEGEVCRISSCLSPFLSGKSARVCVAMVSYITWQAHGLPLTFSAACKAIGIAPPSLRASLKTLSAALGIEWEGTATRFDTWAGFHVRREKRPTWEHVASRSIFNKVRETNLTECDNDSER